ncbi:hypothetical protein AMTR_s00126p00073550 [Amborella trichopoda]|uniref:Uncharacterized protein n=1 Tax=Amborella trichopoda TaxID=13333 RepID=W1NPU5_AMBTC|nr:hypothetical protein AMTR_s00126p00073550 [Amborella trichopoda]
MPCTPAPPPPPPLPRRPPNAHTQPLRGKQSAPSYAEVVAKNIRPSEVDTRIPRSSPPTGNLGQSTVPDHGYSPDPSSRHSFAPNCISVPHAESTPLKSKLEASLVGFFSPRRDDIRGIEKLAQITWKEPNLSYRWLSGGEVAQHVFSLPFPLHNWLNTF